MKDKFGRGDQEGIMNFAKDYKPDYEELCCQVPGFSVLYAGSLGFSSRSGGR
jgi:hypothetical protein